MTCDERESVTIPNRIKKHSNEDYLNYKLLLFQESEEITK